MKHNETTEQNKNNCWESQLARGKPVGYLQVQLESLTRDYQDQIQRVVRAGREPGISGSQGKRSNHWPQIAMRASCWKLRAWDWIRTQMD